MKACRGWRGIRGRAGTLRHTNGAGNAMKKSIRALTGMVVLDALLIAGAA